MSDLLDVLEILENADVAKETFHIGNKKKSSLLELLKMIELMHLEIKINDTFLSQYF